MAEDADVTEALGENLQAECQHLLQQAIEKIRHCAGQLTQDEIWARPRDEMNSMGNLILHLCGNLQQWVVDGVPELPNTRDRDAEFKARSGLSGPELLARLENVVSAAERSIQSVPADGWLRRRRIQGFEVTVLGAILHAVPHFVGHTHQIIQLTRLTRGNDYVMHWRPDADRSAVPL